MRLAEAKPTSDVTVATAISALIGLLGLLVASLTGVEVPPEVVGALSTLVVGGLAIVRRSAKVTAGAMAAALVTSVVWVTGVLGVEVPLDATGYLTTLSLFVFAWITSEA